MSKREISPPRTRSRRRQRFGSLSDNDVAITPVNDTSPLQPRRLEANKSAQQSSPQRSPNTEKRLKESERRMLVSVRCRPLSRSEVASGCLEVVRPFVESQTVVISKQGKSGGVLRSERGAEHEYCFDQVFGALSTNEQVYAAAASHLVADVLKGINCTIFAYGATGAGKTHTMLGSDGGTGKGPSNEDRGGVGDPGVIARAMVDIFKGVEEARQAHADGGVDEVDADVGPMSPLKSVKNSVKGSRVKRRRSGISQGDVVMKAEWRVSVSFLEVYNETIYDLLTTEKQKPLIPCEDPTDQSVNVLGLTQTEVGSTDDVLALLRQGNARRKMEPTAANQVSSRSHAVLQVTIDFIRELRTPGRRLLKVVKRSSRLSMIDLAGSERAAATSNLGARLREGANINKSLLALANCINALSSREKGKKGGAPTRVKYRDSKLTHLLKSSLEGKCRVSMIANINPSNQSYEESHNTLKYANRAKAIKVTASSKGNRVTRMDSPNDERIAELRAQNQELRQQLVLTQRKAKRQEYEHGKQARRFDGDGTGVREEEEGDLENVPFRMNVGPPLPPLQLYPEDGEQDDSDAAETPSRMEDGNNGGYDVRDMMSTPFLPHSCGASTAAGTSGNTNTTASGRRRKRKVNETETAHGGGRRSNKMSNRAVATKRRANSNTGEDEDVLMSPPPEYASYRSNNNASPINSGRESRGKRVSPRVTAVGSGGTAGGGVSVAEARQLKRRIAELENQTNADLRKFAQKQRELKAQISSLSKENTRLVKEATAVKATKGAPGTSTRRKRLSTALPAPPTFRPDASNELLASPHHKAVSGLQDDRMRHHMKQAIKAMQRCDSCRQWSLEMAGALRVAEANGKCDIQRQSGAGVASGAATRSNRRVSGIPRLHMPKLADFGSDSEGGDGDGDDDVGRCGAVGGVNGRGIGESKRAVSASAASRAKQAERRKSGIPMPTRLVRNPDNGVANRTRQSRRTSSQFTVHYAPSTGAGTSAAAAAAAGGVSAGGRNGGAMETNRRQSMLGRIPTSLNKRKQERKQPHHDALRVDSPMSLIGEEDDDDEFDEDL